MKLADIKAGDILVNVDARGAGFCRVLKTCKVKIRVRGENGFEFLSYPHLWDRKINWVPENLK